MVYDYFSEHGLVDFGIANDTITGFFATQQTVIEWNSAEGSVVADLMHLNAAEIALLQDTQFREPGVPLMVPEAAAQLAIAATNSGPFVAHNVRARPRLWDVTLFGSDASKLAWLSESESVEGLVPRYLDVVRQLAGLYAERNDPTGYGAPHLFAMRALLWRAKIAVLLDETDLEQVEEVRRALLS